MDRKDFVKEIEKELGFSPQIKMGGDYWQAVRQVMVDIDELAQRLDEEARRGQDL